MVEKLKVEVEVEVKMEEYEALENFGSLELFRIGFQKDIVVSHLLLF